MFLAKLVRGRMSAPEPLYSFPQPDPENEPEVRHFLSLISSVLREKLWPDPVELRKGLDTLVDLTETRKGYIKEVYGEGWETVLERAVEGEGLVGPVLDVTLNCVGMLSGVKAMLPVLWKLLDMQQDSIIKYTVLKILGELCTTAKDLLLTYLTSDPTVLSKQQLLLLVDLVRSETDYLRNEALLIIRSLCTGNEDIQRSLAYQGIFEALADLLNTEEGVIVNDCLSLIQALSSDFTKTYIREVSSFLPCIQSLFPRSHLYPQLIPLLHSLLKDSKGEVIRNTQLAYSVLIPHIVLLAFPVERTKTQDDSSLSLLYDLLKGNSAQQRDLSLLLLPTDNDFLSFFDVLLTYNVLNSEKHINRAILSLLCTDLDLQTQLISKITAVLGVFTSQTHHFPFNFLLISSLDSFSNLDSLCISLEIVIFRNDVAKELALSLPITTNSQTLMQKLAEMMGSSGFGTSVERVLPVFRLVSVWIWGHPATALAFYGKILGVLPDLIDAISENTSLSPIFAVLLACLVDTLPDNSELGRLILSKIGLPAYCSRLETFLGVSDAAKHLKQGLPPPSIGLFTPSYAVLYRDVVPAAKKSLVRLMSGETSGREQELAKLIQTQEQIIEDLHNQIRLKTSLGLLSPSDSQATPSNDLLQLRLQSLETQKNAEKDVLIAKQEAKDALEAYFCSQEYIKSLEERLFRLENENLILRMENFEEKLVKMMLEKDKLEREVGILRGELGNLRRNLKKFNGNEEISEEKEVKIGLNLPDLAENGGEEPDFHINEEIERVESEILPSNSLISASENTEKVEKVEKIENFIISEPEKPEKAVEAEYVQTKLLFSESPSFPDMNELIESEEIPETPELNQIEAAEKRVEKVEEEEKQGEMEGNREDGERQRVESSILGMQKDGTGTKQSDPQLIPFPSVSDAESFFDQAQIHSSKRPNPFAF